MNKRGITKGDVIPLTKSFSGTNVNGDWLLIKHKWEGTKDTLTIWATNAKEAKNFTGAAKVKDIYTAYPHHEQWNGQWYTTVEYRVALEQAEQGAINAAQAQFEALDEVDDDELPFA